MANIIVTSLELLLPEVGCALGVSVKRTLGVSDGDIDMVGNCVCAGFELGNRLGYAVGCGVGVWDEESTVGLNVGCELSSSVGEHVGI